MERHPKRIRMNTVAAGMALYSLALPVRTAAQAAEPDQIPPSARPSGTDGGTVTPAPTVLPPPAFDRPISWTLMFPNLIADQKRIWSFPARLAQGQSWISSSIILGTTAGLVALDPAEARYFQRTPTFRRFNAIFTGNATAIGTVAVPVSLYAVGLLHKDSKMQRTALLAGEAIADTEILTTVLKDATKRVRPGGFSPSGNLADSWFDSRGSLLHGAGSFPSGHTIAAFSVATVVGRRYANHRWVPCAAYGMAAIVGFSRLTLSAHYLSDVFLGGALGYSITRFTVLRQ